MSADRQIDRQIHEIIHNDKFEHYEWADPIQPGNSLIARRNGVNYYESVPYYSSSWNAMAVLVEWLQGKELRIKFEFLDSVHVHIWHPLDDVDAHGEAESAPLALCRAVLSLPEGVMA